MSHLVNTIYKELSGQQFDVVREMFTNSILFPKSAVRTDTLHRLGADLFKQNNPNAHNQENILPETQGKRLRVEDAFGDKFNVDGLIKDDGVVTGIMLAKLSVQSINKNLKNFRNGIVGELHRYLGNIKNKDNTIYLFNLSPRNTFVLDKNTGKFKNEALPQSFRENSILEMIAPRWLIQALISYITSKK